MIVRVRDERLAHSRSAVIIAVVATLSLAACGGSGSDASTGVGDAFAQRALAVCQTALEDKQGWAAFPVEGFNPSQPEVSRFPEVATWLHDEVAPTFEMWRDGLRALGEPPSGRAAWDDTVAAVTKIAQLNEEQITAANDSDVDAWATATQALRDTQTDLVAASDAAGVPACADVHAA
jgi:hypothetical protein